MSDDLEEYYLYQHPAVRDRLCIRHLPLVKFVARKMSHSLPNHIELDDLVSYGSIGLLDAIDKFDPYRNVKFSTYAVVRIRGSILDGLQQMDWAPKQITSKVRTVRRVREALSVELGYEPSTEQIAEHMECTDEQVRGWLLDDQTMQVRPLDPPIGIDEPFGGRWGEPQVAADQDVAAEVQEICGAVAAAVATLGERERAVFLLYYRDSLTLREIATQLGVSVSSATQAHTRLVEHVRSRMALQDRAG